MRYSTNRPLRFAACSLFFALGLCSASHAFTTIQLTDLFYSEGANFGDFNNDGIKDIVAGPYWYARPTYTQRTAYMALSPANRRAHERALIGRYLEARAKAGGE